MNDETIEDQVIEEETTDDLEPEESSEETADSAGPRLILKRGGAESEEVFPFSCPAVVGRFDPSVGPIDIDLGSIPEGSYVSRRHAQITEEDGVFTIEDLGSSNGTYVLADDFEKVDSAPIEDGNEVAFGNARFIFRIA